MPVRRKRIADITRDILTGNDVTGPPVPIEAIVKKHGLKLHFRRLDSDLSGFLYRDAIQSVIGVNSQHAKVRQRFTMAHELAHFLLHRGESLHVDRAVQAKFRSTISSQGVNPEEIEANLFAASLLMPAEFLQRDIAEIKPTDILDDKSMTSLAKHYDVSTQALLLRLVNLRFIEQ